MNYRVSLLIASVAVIAMSATSVSEANIILSQWDFSSNANASSTHADVTSASAFTHTGGSFDNAGRSSGPGVNLDGSSYTSGEPIHDQDTSGWTGDDGRYFARAFDDVSITSSTKHFAFHIELAPGVFYNLENVWFDFAIRSRAGDQISVQMSPNSDFSDPVVIGEGEATGLKATTLGYIDDSGTTSLGINQAGNDQWFSWNRLENTLNTPIVISDTTYFRIYVAGGEDTNDPRDGNYVDNLTIIATDAIPEPATAGLLALGGLVMLGVRRRRQA